MSTITLRSMFGAAALAAVALALAAPASAAVDSYKQYPTAVAADVAEVMAKFGGVVIDVETKFPGRALDLRGCGIIKHDTMPTDQRVYNFTHCGPSFALQPTFVYEGGPLTPGEPPVTVELPEFPEEGGLTPVEPGGQ